MLNENDRRSAATSAIAERNVMAAHRAEMLIVVDVQNDFCPGGALAVPDGDAVVPVINRLAGRFAHRIVTQDWHPADHTSFAIAHPGKAPFETTQMPSGTQALWPVHFVQGSAGAAFPPDLAPAGVRSDEHTSALQSLLRI